RMSHAAPPRCPARLAGGRARPDYTGKKAAGAASEALRAAEALLAAGGRGGGRPWAEATTPGGAAASPLSGGGAAGAWGVAAASPPGPAWAAREQAKLALEAGSAGGAEGVPFAEFSQDQPVPWLTRPSAPCAAEPADAAAGATVAARAGARTDAAPPRWRGVF
ncbi:unnamed protein product, partial [Prorocentrum cordatum]